MPAELACIYRVAADRPSKERPDFYGQETCARSLLRTVDACEAHVRIFVIDDAVEQPTPAATLVASRADRVLRTSGLGNSATFRHALAEIVPGLDEPLVIFAEDDYLYVETAFAALVAVASHLRDAEYFTLYDHPVRYAADYKFGLDLPHHDTQIRWSAGSHWRTQESTCMSFAARREIIVQDQPVFDRYLAGEYPQDRELFRRLQGLPGYEAGSPKRLLLGPMPSLATHCHREYLAPGVDWRAVAASSDRHPDDHVS